jgi:hypothetical protein
MKKFWTLFVFGVLVYFASLGCSFKGGGKGPDLITDRIVSVYSINRDHYIFLGEKYFIVLDANAAPVENWIKARDEADIFRHFFGKEGCYFVIPKGVGVGEIKSTDGRTKVHINIGIIVDKNEAAQDLLYRAKHNATRIVMGNNNLMERVDVFHELEGEFRGEVLIDGYVYKSSKALLDKSPKLEKAFDLTLADFGLDAQQLKEMPSRYETIGKEDYLKRVALRK